MGGARLVDEVAAIRSDGTPLKMKADVLAGPERRGRWSSEEKARIVAWAAREHPTWFWHRCGLG